MMRDKATWRFTAHEIAEAVGSTASLRAAARKLGCNVSTVSRAVQAGKVAPKAGRKPRDIVTPPTADGPRDPAAWATSVRATYQFTASEDQLVTLAERALTIAGDDDQRASDRLAAMRTFAGLIKQLDLPMETSTNGDIETPAYPRRVG